MLETFYCFHWGDGSIHELKLTREEFEQMVAEDYSIFESYEEAVRFARGE